MLALLLAVAQPLTAAAAELDTEAPCSLTLHYTKEGSSFQDLNIKIYRIATFESDGSYALTGPFADYPVQIQDIQSQKEWQESTQALVSYVEADALTPTAEKKTDASGTVAFENLDTGLYLVMGVQAQAQDGRFWFQPFIVFLPTPNEDGSYDYDVEAIPKPGPILPIHQYQVIKLWKDSGNQGNRPGSVTIGILKDGILQETVVLDQQNSWTHAWESEDGNSRWTVVETEVPNGYTVAVSQQGGTFTVTNEYHHPHDPDKPDKPDTPDKPDKPGTPDTPEKPNDPNTPTKPNKPGSAPQTGDSTPLWLYVMALCGSGMALVLLGAPRKREQA